MYAPNHPEKMSHFEETSMKQGLMMSFVLLPKVAFRFYILYIFTLLQSIFNLGIWSTIYHSLALYSQYSLTYTFYSLISHSIYFPLPLQSQFTLFSSFFLGILLEQKKVVHLNMNFILLQKKIYD